MIIFLLIMNAVQTKKVCLKMKSTYALEKNAHKLYGLINIVCHF